MSLCVTYLAATAKPDPTMPSAVMAAAAMSGLRESRLRAVVRKRAASVDRSEGCANTASINCL